MDKIEVDVRRNSPFYENNFNLIRLFAACQVAHYHLISIYGLEINDAHRLIVKLLGIFPGVPIFFFISGFLISKSWETSQSWKDYAIKRVARIEPALFVSIIFAIALTYFSGYLSPLPPVSDLLSLVLAKTTLLQFYNPHYLRGYGDGVLNGSIWTICVEIQFYIILPLCYLLIFKNNKKILIYLFIIFVVISSVIAQYKSVASGSLISKLFTVSFFPWYYMFLTGVIFQKYFYFFYKILSGKFLHTLLLYFAGCYIGGIFNVDFGNTFNPILFILLAALVFSTAYSRTGTAKQLLRDADISYGIYLYHMPIINYCIYLNFSKSYAMASIIIFTVVSISCVSWFSIEKPSLKVSKKIYRS